MASVNNCTIDAAAQFAAELRANVDRWQTEPNPPATYPAFSARNGAIWRRIEASGEAVEEEVLRILRTRD